MNQHKELLTCIIHENDEGLSISYWPESTLPEEARNWCRELEGTATLKDSEMKVDLWYTGGYYFYTRAD